MTMLYTTQLGAGQSIIEESRILLDLWQPGMTKIDLFNTALQTGRFPNMSARRLRNLIVEGFGPRFLHGDEKNAEFMKKALSALSTHEFEQLLFLSSCRAHPVLHDFVCQVYWDAYGSGRETISNEETRAFMTRAVEAGRTTTSWSYNMIERVAGYVTGSCADFGLLERGQKSVRRIIPYRIEPRVAAIIAYDFHFSGLGDNSLLQHPDWQLFGLNPDDVLNEFKRLALKGWLIVQSAGGVIDISWLYKSIEELLHAFTQSEL